MKHGVYMKHLKKYILSELLGNYSVEANYIMGVGMQYAEGFEWAEHLICFSAYGTTYIGAGCPYCEISYGIDEVEKDKLNSIIKPNPIEHTVTVQIPIKSKNAILTIYSMEGQQSGKYSLKNSETIINLDYLLSGAYLFKITYNNVIEIQKVIKE